jgi:broad specificity phosphatase PhoE
MSLVSPSGMALGAALALALAGASAAATTLVLVRHAEKAAGDDPPLTPAGVLRAERLAALFATSVLTAIYITDTRRSAETAAPTARAEGVVPQVRSRRDAAAHARALADELRQRPDSDLVLAVEHSDTVPLLLGALGVASPPVLTDADYGDVFVVTWSGAAGTPALLRLSLPAPK